ncbi:S-layer protein [Paenibacillus sp. P3E]|uniref:S-layer homology domain-containing protein n=1 Tax=unclassified Paenibacillus TaxID=185978 RepID=UPI00093D48BF|nr:MULTISPECIES: S-layer homology domain-containing protein [unclassified Paenibacillus]OKP83083.1 S-layer protein [Paenibacillus sp. P32E]OKP93256.1 S-layer protein [Paenibacillus sp. P3E]
MKKNTLKQITLSAAAVLTLTFAGQSFAAAATFQDLSSTPVKDKIAELQQRGVIHGVSDTQFMPNATITAAQGIQMFVNAFGLNIDLLNFVKAPQATDYFANAHNDAWYANALIIAANNDIGLSPDLNPAKNWTREEFTHQLILTIEKHSNLPMIKIMPVDIADQAEFTNGFDGSIQRALALKIASLDGTGKFHPSAGITRAEAAEMIYNALKYIDAHPAPAGGLPE